jgi:hypothetical protein
MFRTRSTRGCRSGELNRAQDHRPTTCALVPESSLAPGSGSVPSALSYEELVQGATILGTDSSAPYGLNAPIPACQVLPECYVFAVAHDKAGNHTTSELRGVTTDRTYRSQDHAGQRRDRGVDYYQGYGHVLGGYGSRHRD